MHKRQTYHTQFLNSEIFSVQPVVVMISWHILVELHVLSTT